MLLKFILFVLVPCAILLSGNYLWTNRIARADVADFMLKQLTDDDYIGSAVGVVW